MQVHLNGRMIPYEQARIAHDDASVQHAVGLFETMAAVGGRVFRLRAHLDRLDRSARELGLSRRIDVEALAGAVEETLACNGLKRARVRLTLTPGRISLLRAAESEAPEPTILIVATEPTEYHAASFQRGIKVVVGPQLANPFDPLFGHKTVSYWSRLGLLRRAAAAGAGEAIVLNVSNHLAGGAVSNLFLVKDGRLLTPFASGEEKQGALPAPVLPGITRTAVLELAETAGLETEKRMLSIADLLEGEEAFLTNSSWQVLPVTTVEKTTIGDGRVGPITTQLRAALLGLIEEETRAGGNAMRDEGPD